METIRYPQKKDLAKLLERPAINRGKLELKVKEILLEVKLSGDAALRKFSEQFDQVQLTELTVKEEEFAEADELLNDELKNAIVQAKQNIEKFHAEQKEEIRITETIPGVSCWRKQVGIEKVGLYVPGGSAPLFSTVLMLGVPAMLAGCSGIVLCTPPGKDGKIDPAVLFTASLVGIKKIIKAGGAQAIAAMAYGTETVPAVYKIFGPGNQYVTCAKQMVSMEGVAIDMPAGPSEVAVLADSSCVPSFVAADLLSQAEHGTDSQVILVSDSETVLEEVKKELVKQLEALPRKQIAAEALTNSRFILVANKTEAMELLNAYAPEHLILACENDEGIAEQVVNAGSVFLGNYSCESAGDYASGTNHTLPTGGNAKAYSGVSLESFTKKITFQKLTKEGIKNIGNTVELMAKAEGLEGHRNAVVVRRKYKK